MPGLDAHTANLAARLLLPNLARHPDKTAYFCLDKATSYQQLGAGAYRFAALLRDRGIGQGDRVLLALLDSPVFVAAFLGCCLIGAVAVPVGTALDGVTYDFLLTDSNARLALVSPVVAAIQDFPRDRADCLVCGEDLAGVLSDLPSTPVPPVAVGLDDLAFMLYTSGSTGRPKGVPHRHPDLVEASERFAAQVLGMNENDRVLSASKLYFGYGLGNSLAFPLALGATTVLHPGLATPDQLLALMERHRPTLFFSVPTIYAQILRGIDQDRLDLPMRLCVSAGEALPAAIVEEWGRLTGLDLLDGIGSTEMTHIFLANRPGDLVPGSAGWPVPGYEVRLVDDDGNPVAPGTDGHLLVRGPGAAPYYWNRPDKTAETMLADGFVRTGDVFVEKEGRYWHRGRSDDMLKVGGQWISPVQVEEALRAHPAVFDCAVAACRVGGLERPAAHLIPRPGHDPGRPLEKALRAFLAARLPDYMCPLVYRFVDDLPRTPTGKVQRFKLRQ